MKNQNISDTIVRVIYLIPKGKSKNQDFVSALEKGIINVQEWYKSQLGVTFKLHTPTVEILKSNCEPDWFLYYPCNNPHNYKSPHFNSYYNSKLECKLLGLKDYDEKFTWVCYLDGGFQGCGLNSFAFLPIEDLLNLTLEINFNKNENCRWVGGLAHELGHALGLNDLKNYTNDYKEEEYLMGSGFVNFPNTELTNEDKEILTPRLLPGYNGPPPINTLRQH